MKVLIAERFWKKVNKDGPIPSYNPDLGPCWVWLCSLSNGYGWFWSELQRGIGAHKWSYEASCGAVPSGLELDHLCRVRACVRPSHLEPVTRQDCGRTSCSRQVFVQERRTVRCRRPSAGWKRMAAFVSQ